MPVQPRAIDVDPQQRLRAIAPQRGLAEHVVAAHGAVDGALGHAAFIA